MISVSKVRAHVPAAATITDDTIIADLIERAVAYVQSQTRRYFGDPRTISEYVTGLDSYDLHLPERARDPDVEDSDETAGIIVTERAQPSDAGTAVTSFQVRNTDDYFTILRRQDGALWRNPWEYEVQYTHGYEVNEGPKDVEALLLSLLALRVNLIGKEGMQSETIGGYSYTRGDFAKEADSLPSAEATLTAWRRLVVV